jgi:hypothetical protein
MNTNGKAQFQSFTDALISAVSHSYSGPSRRPRYDAESTVQEYKPKNSEAIDSIRVYLPVASC